jgi:hypothetical protein
MSDVADIPVTCSIPAFGYGAYDLSRSAAYEAANEGKIPFIEVRGKKRVPFAIAALPLVGDNPDAMASLVARVRAAEAAGTEITNASRRPIVRGARASGRDRRVADRKTTRAAASKR